MTRSRGALSIKSINATYPHQVILHFTAWHRANLILLLNDRERLGGYRLWTEKHHGIHEFSDAHFPTKKGQEEFISLYGGLPYDPSDKKSKPWETYFERCESLTLSLQSRVTLALRIFPLGMSCMAIAAGAAITDKSRCGRCCISSALKRS